MEALRIMIESNYKSLPAMNISEKHKNVLQESQKQIEIGMEPMVVNIMKVKLQ